MGQITELVEAAYENAVEHGWWEEGREDGTLIALMHSELSEALEALRKGDEANLAEELADVVIRIMDYCGHRGIDLENAILVKMAINKNRPYKHGGKRF